MDYQHLTFDVTDQIATIRMHRPDDGNALDHRMATEFADAAIRCSTDANIRAVIVTGTGKMFCVGGDLKDMQAQGDNAPQHLVRMATGLHTAIVRMAHMDAPVIMALNGTAAGGGFSLALSGDYIIASEKAKMVAAYTASALTPDGSSTYFLAKHVGLLRAKELLMTNRVLTAAEAQSWGMVNKVVPPDELMPEAQKMAATFATGATKAYGGVKRLLLTAYSDTIETQLDKETLSISDMMRTRDGRHGLSAFLNKEKPSFRGE